MEIIHNSTEKFQIEAVRRGQNLENAQDNINKHTVGSIKDT